MKLLLVLQMARISLGSPNPPPSEDVTFSLDVIKEVADYPNMCMFCDKTLVGVGDKLQTFDTYSTGYIESVIKITKNFLGPKIEYLNSAGIMKINSGEVPLEKVEFDLFGAEASVHLSNTGAGAGAVVKLAGGKVSIFQLQLALGVSTEMGIIDDSVAVKVLGVGGSIGRVNKICVFDSCFGVDLGALFG